MNVRDDTYPFWRVFGAHTCAIKEEAYGGGLLSLTITERIHELLQGGGAFNLEENLIVVVGYFDVQVFDGRWGTIAVARSS